MKFSILLLTIIAGITLLFFACRHKHDKDHQHEEGHDEHQHDTGSHEGHNHGDVNEHMHQTPFEDLVKRFESPERDAYQQPEKVMAYLGDVSGKSIVDIGAGTGYFSFRLAKAGAKVTAADVNDQFLGYISEKVKKEGLESLGIITKKVPYDDPLLEKGKTDMVLIVNTYHHIEDRAVYCAKVLEGLSGNGELVIIDFFKKELPVGPPPEHKLSPDDVKAELSKAGFTQFEVNDTMLEYQYIVRARRG